MKGQKTRTGQHGHGHTGVRSIDYFAYTSGLCGWNAAFKMVFSLSMLIFCIAADSIPVSLFTLSAMTVLIVGLGGLEMRHYLALLSVPLGFLVMSGLTLALHASGAPQGEFFLHLHFFYVYTSSVDLFYALSLTLKALGAVSCMYLMTLTTPASEIVGVLRRAHVPKIMVELMYLIYRFIFILLDVHGRMHAAAASRLGHRDFRASVRSFGGIAGNLLVLSMRRASTYYDAMESRCYGGEMRFLEQEKPARAWQIVLAGGILAAAFVLLQLTERGG